MSRKVWRIMHLIVVYPLALLGLLMLSGMLLIIFDGPPNPLPGLKCDPGFECYEG